MDALAVFPGVRVNNAVIPSRGTEALKYAQFHRDRLRALARWNVPLQNSDETEYFHFGRRIDVNQEFSFVINKCV